MYARVVRGDGRAPCGARHETETLIQRGVTRAFWRGTNNHTGNKDNLVMAA